MFEPEYCIECNARPGAFAQTPTYVGKYSHICVLFVSPFSPPPPPPPLLSCEAHKPARLHVYQ